MHTVFLDNNAWNLLVDDQLHELTVERLVQGYRAGLLQVIGSLELQEELLGTARLRPAKYKQMLRLYKNLTGRRILLPLLDRHRAEVKHGGLLPPAERYISKSVQRRKLDAMMTAPMLVIQIGQEVWERKRSNQKHASWTGRRSTRPSLRRA